MYLMKSGKYYKIGRTNAIGRREYELAIQLPEKPTKIHEIKTDDPVGIEAYWHKRFESRRLNGEWFNLTPQDTAAFKRWRLIA
nr:GIY-YIG nuclease family protein [Candidatus Thiodictyon syntrophicum]